jgi:Protein of unknown function (DUF3788)
MEIQNAFIGKENRPSPKELSAALGPAAAPWDELISWLGSQGIACTEWRSVSPKYGWALRPTLKKRTILWMAPCEGCFRASFILGDRAVAAARASNLSKGLLKEIAEARRYAEGTGLRLLIRHPGDLKAVRALVEIKLKN